MRPLRTSRLSPGCGCKTCKSGVQACARLSIRKVPHFRFRLTVQPRCHGRGGMHLHRKILRAVEHLDQQREPRSGMLGKTVTEDFLTMICPKLVQRLPSQRTFDNGALAVSAITQFPRFSIRPFIRQMTAEFGFETPASPYARVVLRVKRDGTEGQLAHRSIETAGLHGIASDWRGKVVGHT
jgi:hypothetical protein